LTRLNPPLSKIPQSNVEYQSHYGAPGGNPFSQLAGPGQQQQQPNLGYTRPSMEGPLNTQSSPE